MSSELIPSLESFKISNENLIDITDDFFNITSKVEYSHIVKSNNFSLLHGTHALELLNPRLDTYLLEKTAYSINQELSLLQATSIISNQLKSLTCWLGQNVGIPNSILSCEYITHILETYTRTGNLNSVNITSSDDSYRSIVLKFSILLISTTKFIVNLALKSQIYEDEDLNTNTMNLNWFYQLTNNDIFKLTLISNKTWKHLESTLQNKEDVKYLNFIKDSFQLLTTLSSLDSVFQWKIPLFIQNSKSKDFNTRFNNKIKQLELIVQKLNDLELLDIDSIPIVKGCFNLNSQIKFDNQAPPKALQIQNVDWSDSILNLTQLFNDLIDVLNLLKSKDMIQLVEWLRYLEIKRNNVDSNEINGLHIIARILFFSLINSESGTVLNVDNLTFKNFFWLYLKQFTLGNTSLDKEISKRKPSNPDAMQQIDYYLDTVSEFWRESIFLPSLNPSRQRQFKCKELKYWNMRQTETSALEDYFKDIKFYSTYMNHYPLTFNIIYFKLRTINDVIFKSIELNLFKDAREFTSAYQQLAVSIHYYREHFDNLLSIAPASSKLYLTYLFHENLLTRQLTVVKAQQFEILMHLGFGELPKNLIKNKDITERLLFQLQWKQFQKIDDPRLVDFDDHKHKTEFTGQELEEDFDVFHQELANNMSDSIVFAKGKIDTLESLMDKLNWFDELKTIKLLEFESLKTELVKMQSDNEKLFQILTKYRSDMSKVKDDYNLRIVHLGRHRYFPGFKLIKKE